MTTPQTCRPDVRTAATSREVADLVARAVYVYVDKCGNGPAVTNTEIEAELGLARGTLRQPIVRGALKRHGIVTHPWAARPGVKRPSRRHYTIA